ncbi:hyaluronate lyase, partial [Paenibacillus sp. UNCCL117]|uniref:polysaccharide lyase 8 family protein n=1 Tax=unclassified Paenibacillus TaxID=185978 RepID=UPI0008902817
MSKNAKRLGIMMTVMLLLLMSVNSLFVNQASAADEFDTLRSKWKVMLTGGTSYNASDPNIAAAISRITAAAQTNWDSMDKSSGRTYLWSDLSGPTDSKALTASYGRVKSMALAYSTHGSPLQNNSALLNDTIGALDWLYANRYNENKTEDTLYWWDWEIGIPMALNDITVLLYNNLSSAQRTDYMAAVNKFTPKVSMTGANRVWKASVVGVRGIIIKDGAQVSASRDGLSAVFNYVTTGDGFYKDGSFIQHGKFPYNGGYGSSLLSDIAKLMYLLGGSTYEVTDPDRKNVYEWVYEAFEPLMYKGAMMDMVRGRNISRYYSDDHIGGHAVIRAIIRLSQVAPSADAMAYRSMVKHWLQTDTYNNFVTDAPIDLIVVANAILNNSGIISRGELVKHKQYPNMDRAVHLRPGFGFGISMFSTRIYNYERGNGENIRGWHTSDGMNFLYNNDLSQFSDGFWPTVNSFRLPGTTVLHNNTVLPRKISDKGWVGGTDLLNTYGVSGMYLHTPDTDLKARKSWFMFDDEIVALGSDIDSTDGIPVETIVENRKLTSSGDNALTVNGTAKSTALGWSETMTDVNWAHLAGNVPGSDIGYYFPGSATVEGIREARTGSWSQIDTRPRTPTAPITHNYMNLWLDHGSNPTNGRYAYVLLPGKTSAQVSGYAANPNIAILENTINVHAVKETDLNITGANFWNGGYTAGIITSDSKAAVMTKENTGEDIEVSVSDPTHLNTGSITIEIAKRAFGTISADAGITV